MCICWLLSLDSGLIWQNRKVSTADASFSQSTLSTFSIYPPAPPPKEYDLSSPASPPQFRDDTGVSRPSELAFPDGEMEYTSG
eukprot:6188211-Pleurochrysis_carterae.AAC.4